MQEQREYKKIVNHAQNRNCEIKGLQREEPQSQCCGSNQVGR